MTAKEKQYCIKQYELGKLDKKIVYTNNLAVGYYRYNYKRKKKGTSGGLMVKIIKWGEMYLVEPAIGFNSRKFYKILKFEGIVRANDY